MFMSGIEASDYPISLNLCRYRTNNKGHVKRLEYKNEELKGKIFE